MLFFSHYDLQAIFTTLERLITYLKHCCHFYACSWELTCHFLVEVSVSTITGCSSTFENSICNSLSKSQSVRKHLQRKYYNKSWETVDETQFTSFTAWKPILLTELRLVKQISFFLLYCICFAGCQENRSLDLTEQFSVTRYLTCLFLLEIGFHFSCLLQQQVVVSREERQLLL